MRASRRVPVTRHIGKGLALVSIALTSACSTFEGLKLADEPSKPCRHASVAPAPQTFDNDLLGNTFDVAVSGFDFSPGDGTVGFDLDGTCTGQGQAPSCRLPTWAVNHDDGPDGRDNVLSELPTTADGGMGNNQSNAFIEQGFLTTVLRIRNYNGLPSDGRIDVELFAATRATGDHNSVSNPPHWDGADVWNPLVEWTSQGATNTDGGTTEVVARYRSDRAYVNNHILVAHFEEALGADTLLFYDQVFQARIERAGMTSWTLRDGVSAGRLPIDQILAALQFTPDGTTGLPTCTDSPSYPATKKAVCSQVDIRYADNDPSAPCDAASWAWKFETGPAILSNNVNPVRGSDYNRCPKETLPAFDSCASLDGEPPGPGN